MDRVVYLSCCVYTCKRYVYVKPKHNLFNYCVPDAKPKHELSVVVYTRHDSLSTRLTLLCRFDTITTRLTRVYVYYTITRFVYVYTFTRLQCLLSCTCLLHDKSINHETNHSIIFFKFHCSIVDSFIVP